MSRGKKSGGHKGQAPRARNVSSARPNNRQSSKQALRLTIRQEEGRLYEQAVMLLEREMDGRQPFFEASAPDLLGRLERELIGSYSLNQAPLRGNGVLNNDELISREPRMWSRASQKDVSKSADRIMQALLENPDADLKELVMNEESNISIGDELWSRPVDAVSQNKAIITPAGRNLGRKGEEMALYSQVELALAGVDSTSGNANIVLDTNLSQTQASQIVKKAFQDTIGKRQGYKVLSSDDNLVSPF